MVSRAARDCADSGVRKGDSVSEQQRIETVENAERWLRGDVPGRGPAVTVEQAVAEAGLDDLCGDLGEYLANLAVREREIRKTLR